MALMKSNPRRCAVIPVPEPCDMVKNGLALTPSQMYELQKQGLPISNQVNGLVFEDGSYKCDWHVLQEYQRGVDPADLFEREQATRHKAKTAFANLEASASSEK